MTPSETKILAAFTSLQSNLLTVTWRVLHKKTGLAQDGSLRRSMPNLIANGYIYTHRQHHNNQHEYRLTEKGWATAGVRPPMGVE